MIARRFQTPLLGTALVLLALAVVAVPLHRLTAHGGGAMRTGAPAAPVEPATAPTHAVLRIRTLDGLRDIRITDSRDQVIHQADAMDAGETESDVNILLEKGSADVHLSARAGEKDTAVFLTLLPDGREERTAYAIGSGTLDETLHFQWEEEHE